MSAPGQPPPDAPPPSGHLPGFTPVILDDTVNVSPDRALPEFFKLLASAIGLALLAYLALGFALEALVVRVPVETEMWMLRHIGQSAEARIAGETKPEDGTWPQSLLDSLPAAVKPAGYDFRVTISPSPDPNALALPGGVIVITRGLLESLESENALVFVLGHELGHFRNRDHLRGMGRGLSALLLSAALLGQDSRIVRTISGVTLTTDMAFSRKAEQQADEWGLKTLMAHYDHTGGVREVFRILDTSEKTFTPELFLTHPHTAKRQERIGLIVRQQKLPAGEPVPLHIPEGALPE